MAGTWWYTCDVLWCEIWRVQGGIRVVCCVRYCTCACAVLCALVSVCVCTCVCILCEVWCGIGVGYGRYRVVFVVWHGRVSVYTCTCMWAWCGKKGGDEGDCTRSKQFLTHTRYVVGDVGCDGYTGIVYCFLIVLLCVLLICTWYVRTCTHVWVHIYSMSVGGGGSN